MYTISRILEEIATPKVGFPESLTLRTDFKENRAFANDIITTKEPTADAKALRDSMLAQP